MGTCEKCGRPPRNRLRRGLCEADYDKWRRRQKAYGRFDELSDYTDARPAHEHVNRLRKANVGLDIIAELSGLPRRTVQEVGRRQPRTIQKPTAYAILSVPLPVKPHSLPVADNTFIDPTGTIRRLQAMVVAGHPMSQLSMRLGYRGNPITYLVNGHRKFITAAFARKVDALYAELEDVPGPSDRARADAADRGWAPAIAWDDDTIDDPKAKPQHKVHRHVQFAERYEELVQHCDKTDKSQIIEHFEKHFEANPKHVERQIWRYAQKQRKALAS